MLPKKALRIVSLVLQTRAASGEAKAPLRPEPRQPLLWAALAFAAGISAGPHLWRPAPWWTLSTIVFLASAAYWSQKRTTLANALALAALFMLGALNLQVRTRNVSPSPVLPFADGREVTVTAHVIAEGNIRKAGLSGTRQVIDVETEEITSDDATVHLNSGVRLSIYAKTTNEDEPKGPASEMRLFHYGERLRFQTKLRLPRNFRNPGAFDYAGYLADHGISALGSARRENIELLPGFAGNRMEMWRARVHRSVINKVHVLWEPADAVLMDAMVIGEEAFIDRDERVNF
ncbi:MAG TPA: ComEC/Rec2 family competence protein, partial [Terriglobales bacterium]|nr:ComEC/Rec2 family competence protein [Terriglobales bacterium]